MSIPPAISMNHLTLLQLASVEFALQERERAKSRENLLLLTEQATWAGPDDRSLEQQNGVNPLPQLLACWLGALFTLVTRLGRR